MEMPNLQHVIQYVRDSQAWDFTTKEGLCAYNNACVYALSTNDPGFGHLTKNEGQNHCTDPTNRLHATDVAMYKPTGQVVDFIASAGYGIPPPSNDVVWMPGPIGEYPPTSWFAAVPNSDSGSGGGTTPTPPANDYSAQLDRMEAMLLEMKTLLSNMNAQMGLGFGAVNDVIVRQDRPLGGTLPRQGGELVLTPK